MTSPAIARAWPRSACRGLGRRAPADTLATLVDRRLLRIEERLDVRRVELTHDVPDRRRRASRDVALEREARDEASATALPHVDVGWRRARRWCVRGRWRPYAVCWPSRRPAVQCSGTSA